MSQPAALFTERIIYVYYYSEGKAKGCTLKTNATSAWGWAVRCASKNQTNCTTNRKETVGTPKRLFPRKLLQLAELPIVFHDRDMPHPTQGVS